MSSSPNPATRSSAPRIPSDLAPYAPLLHSPPGAATAYPAESPTPVVQSRGLLPNRRAKSEHGDEHEAALPASILFESRVSAAHPAQQSAGTASHRDKWAPKGAAGSLAIRDRSSRSTQRYWALVLNVFSYFGQLPPQFPIITLMVIILIRCTSNCASLETNLSRTESPLCRPSQVSGRKRTRQSLRFHFALVDKSVSLMGLVKGPAGYQNCRSHSSGHPEFQETVV